MITNVWVETNHKLFSNCLKGNVSEIAGFVAWYLGSITQGIDCMLYRL